MFSPSDQSRSSAKKSYKIASIPGDGIGPEVISAGIKVLEKVSKKFGTFDLEFTHFDWSSKYYKKHGKYMPDGLEVIKRFDAVLFGCVGDLGGCFSPFMTSLSLFSVLTSSARGQ